MNSNKQFDNEMRFVLFQNGKTKDTHPDVRGEVTIGGVTYKLTGWKSTSANGKSYLSGKVEEFTEDELAAKAPAKQEDIPF